MAELAWRSGLVLASINLCLMALAVARINPRGTRSGQILLGLFTFIVYYNLINLGQSWISAGRISFTGLLVGLHGGVFLLAVGLIAMRDRQWSWRAWTKRGTARASSGAIQT